MGQDTIEDSVYKSIHCTELTTKKERKQNMAYGKQEQLRFTIAGIACYPSTHVPRSFDQRVNKSVVDEEGSYTCDVLVSEEKADKLKEALEKNIKDNAGVCKRVPTLPIKQETDRETGEPTGRYIIKTKQKAMVKGVKKHVLHVDASTHPITDPSFRLTGGSTVNVAVHSYVHPFGITLYIDGIQVVELAENQDFDSLFEKQDGFVAAHNADEEATMFTKADSDSGF